MQLPGQDDIDRLEEQIRRLKIQYDLFFAGVRKLPPSEDRRKVEEAMRDLQKGKLRDNTSRFRYATLNSRYNRFQELWSRQMREREEGPVDFRQRKAAMQAAPPPPPEPEAKRPPVTEHGADTYVRVTASSNGEAMKELHKLVAEASRQIGKAAPSPEQVAALVEKQAEQLRGRYKTDAIAFRVETVDGKVRLKAKPVG